jgi:hypothetical protein
MPKYREHVEKTRAELEAEARAVALAGWRRWSRAMQAAQRREIAEAIAAPSTGTTTPRPSRADRA